MEDNKENISALRTHILRQTEISAEERKRSLLLSALKDKEVNHTEPEEQRKLTMTLAAGKEKEADVPRGEKEDASEALQAAMDQIRSLLQEKDTMHCEIVQLKNTIASLQTLTDTLKRESQGKSDKLGMYQTIFDRLQSENEEVLENWDKMTSAVDRLQVDVQFYATANEKLQISLEEVLADNVKLLQERLGLKETEAKLAALEKEYEAMFEEQRHYINTLREGCEAIQSVVALNEALQLENEQLKGSLAAAGGRAKEWEERFLTIKKTTTTNTTVSQAAVDFSNTTERRPSEDTTEGEPSTLYETLNSKIIDLTVTLQCRQQQVTQLEEKYEAAMQGPLRQGILLTTLRAALAVSRPLAEELLSENKSLQAQLTATESFANALLDAHVTLLALYTEEVIKVNQQQEATTGRSSKGGRPSVTLVSGKRERHRDAVFLAGKK
ncbi:hypothetical protein ADEAN_000844600 [Angomonas deanei]|uniref:Uncharacterized protein n=1 Tax=Angomonas deanei TaxID=59799 RepID=A0A7G2CRW1_9TRYP|nr:hypothetical protein ADEAN_000844600 [Angomonas deanei]